MHTLTTLVLSRYRGIVYFIHLSPTFHEELRTTPDSAQMDRLMYEYSLLLPLMFQRQDSYNSHSPQVCLPFFFPRRSSPSIDIHTYFQHFIDALSPLAICLSLLIPSQIVVLINTCNFAHSPNRDPALLVPPSFRPTPRYTYVLPLIIDFCRHSW